MPPSCHRRLPPAPCALTHLRAHRWGSAGVAGGSQRPSPRGRWECTCRCCGKRRRGEWAHRRARQGWRTPRVRFHFQAPLWREREGLNNLLTSFCGSIIYNKYAPGDEMGGKVKRIQHSFNIKQIDSFENHSCRKEDKETHSVWGPGCRGTATAHPERLEVLPLTGSQMTQSPSHPPPPTHHTSATTHQTDNTQETLHECHT